MAYFFPLRDTCHSECHLGFNFSRSLDVKSIGVVGLQCTFLLVSNSNHMSIIYLTVKCYIYFTISSISFPWAKLLPPPPNTHTYTHPYHNITTSPLRPREGYHQKWIGLMKYFLLTGRNTHKYTHTRAARSAGIKSNIHQWDSGKPCPTSLKFSYNT